MAKSGSFSAKVTDYDTLRFEWEVTSQSKSTMSSSVKWRLWLVSSTYGQIISSGLKDCTVTVNGTKYTDKVDVSIGNNQSKVILNNTTTVPHNADGTKTFSVSFGVNFNIFFNNKHISTIIGAGSGTLDTIIREARILELTDLTDEGAPTVKYENKAGNSATTLQACISSIGATDDIAAYRDISKTGSSYTFNLTTEEKQRIWARAGDSTIANVRFYIKTVLDGKTYYHYQAAFITIEPAPPIVTIELDDGNTMARALTGGYRFIKGYSEIEYKITATAQKGSAIHTVKAIYDGETQLALSGLFRHSNSAEFKVSVNDERFFSRQYNYQLNLIDYPKVSCELSDVRLETDNKLYFTISGSYYSDSFGAVNNFLALKYRYKEVGGSWNSYQTVTPTLDRDNNTYSIDVVIDDLHYLSSYVIEANAQDELTVATATQEINSIPIFDWGKNDFNFNVPVTVMGQPITPPDDYIIESGSEEMGSNGTWYWHKWNSGRAECYGRRNFGNMAVSTAWGGLYRSSKFTQMLPSGLFSDEPDVIDISLARGNYGGWIAMYESDAPSSTSTGSFIVVRPASATISQAYISFYVVGRWD